MTPFSRNLLPVVLLLFPVVACTPDAFEPPLPDEPIPAPPYAQLSVGLDHACALDVDGRAFCWGAGGALGDGTTAGSVAPVLVAGGHRFRTIHAGQRLSCGITNDDALLCWGFVPVVGERLLPTPFGPEGAKWADVGTGGWQRLCALDDSGRIFCSNVFDADEFDDVSSGRTWASLSVGPGHACGITSDRRGFCWGRNDDRQLGTHAFGQFDEHVPVPLDAEWAELVAGTNFTCGTTMAGATWCWGSPVRGILALDSVTDDEILLGIAEPVAIGDGALRFSELSAAATYYFSTRRTICGKLDIGRVTVVCWGDGQPFSHIGFGVYDWRSIEMGEDRAYGLTNDGRIFGWGAVWVQERVIANYIDWRSRLIYPEIEPVELPAPEREWRDA